MLKVIFKILFKVISGLIPSKHLYITEKAIKRISFFDDVSLYKWINWIDPIKFEYWP